MFSLFKSKNDKMVSKWEKEHKDIVHLATQAIEQYNKHDLKNLR